MAADLPRIEVRSRAELRAWLAENHASSGPVRMITWKKHTPHYLAWGSSVSELLCWGWIDSTAHKVDDDRTSHWIGPRKATSIWSAVNKRKVAEERAAGRMMPAGEAAIAVSQENGMWAFLDDIDRLEVPADLASAIGDRATEWEAYPASSRRAALYWIKTAKTAATRKRRIDDVIQSMEDGLPPPPVRA